MIKLPWPPTVNHYYTVARGRKILSARGRTYKKECGWIMIAQYVPKHTEGKFSITIKASPPDKRRRDLDNLIKPVLDVLTEYGAITDDSDIDELRIFRTFVAKPGQLDIRVCVL